MPFCIGWVENFNEIALSCMIKETEANFCFSIFGQNSKIAKGTLLEAERILFFNNLKTTLIRYPVG